LYHKVNYNGKKFYNIGYILFLLSAAATENVKKIAMLKKIGPAGFEWLIEHSTL
jgi:hypothetical protein